MTNTSHYANLLEMLRQDLQLIQNSELGPSEHQAFVRLAAEWLGYEGLEEGKHFLDGMADLGIDFWYATHSGFELFQVKSHKLGTKGEIQTERFDSDGVKDLQRIVNFLTNENATSKNKNVMRFRKEQWETAVDQMRETEDLEEPFQVSLGLIVFGDGLTEQAQSEYQSFSLKVEEPQIYRGIKIQFLPRLYAIAELTNARWRQDNQDWRDKSGSARTHIDLLPKDKTWIPGRANATFYCRAYDLITAFEDFGYQIFEPNVRAHVEKSQVNREIKKSLLFDRSRREFQFLNNGLTITCNNFTIPSDNRPSFRVNYPGVVNGLQTVVSLHEAYGDLPDKAKTHLKENCYVLVRLLSKQAVQDITKVVLASNTQNKMEPRNLKSNNLEQILYEKLFAKSGWFYERKQGAWHAFSADAARWRTLQDYRKKDFQVGKRERRVDNEIVAQDWLAFIGFAGDAYRRKKEFFDNSDLYDLIFLHRTRRHGSQFNFDHEVAKAEWAEDNPSHTMMLASYLAREFARSASLSGKENKEKATKRLGIGIKDGEKDDDRLVQDSEYLLEQIVSGTSLIFTEFFGYILYKALGEYVHEGGLKLLNIGSLKYLKEGADYDNLSNRIRIEDVEPGDPISIAWFAYRHTIEQILGSAWKQNYLTTPNRGLFLHSNDTRTKIYSELDGVDKFMQKVQLTKFWTVGIPEKTGLYDYFRSVIEKV